jgi:NADH-quinone oxidoreductase subunit J
MSEAVFWVFAAIAVLGAAGVVLLRNPVHSALSLVLTLVAVAALFIQLDAQLLVAVQVIVYAGAIVVLFLFVIMLLGIDRADPAEERLRFQRPIAAVLAVVALAEIIFLGGHQWATGAHADARHAIIGGSSGLGGNVERVARSLFTEFLWPFEITAALLVLAVVGSVLLARRSGQRAVRDTSPGRVEGRS